MRTVWKFPFPIARQIVVQMPAGAEMLHVAEQHGTPTIWALVDPKAMMVNHYFVLSGTGALVDESLNGEFIATFFQGQFVWHLWRARGQP